MKRTDPLVQKAKRRGWYITLPYHTGFREGSTPWAWELERGGVLVMTGEHETRAQAWAMLRACLRVALGRGKR